MQEVEQPLDAANPSGKIVENPQLNLVPSPEEITEHQLLGTIDATSIPPGYGIIYDEETNQMLVTNDTGDVRLFINPDTRHLSSMILKKLEWDPDSFSSVAPTLPNEYQHESASKDLPEMSASTKSYEGTEFAHGDGNGTSLTTPIELIQHSTHKYRDPSVIHLALAKAAQIRKIPMYAILNEIIFTYTPQGNQVEIGATASFRPPRSFDAINKDIEAGNPTPATDLLYHRYLVDNLDDFKDPIEWYKQIHGTDLKTATSMFNRVIERIKEGNL